MMYETLATCIYLSRIANHVHIKLGIVRQYCSGGERMSVPENLESMSEIQEQLSALSRQIKQLASRMLTGSEQQRAEDTANAALCVVPRALDGRSGITAASGEPDETNSSSMT